MSRGTPGDRELLHERAVDAALHGEGWTIDELARAEALELDLAAEVEAYELAAAAIAAAEVERAGGDDVPAHLVMQLKADAARFHAPSSPAAPRLGSVAAAIAAGVALGAAATFAVLRAADGGEPAPDAATFVRSHPNAVHWGWSGTADEHVVGPVHGEAYFDPTTAEGLLEIEGLAANDPSVEQYQLWIFDAERDERYPVDGGVFDVRGSGRTLIPVQARLAVGRPVMFAVTVEKPGGAVVSDRRIALVAKP